MRVVVSSSPWNRKLRLAAVATVVSRDHPLKGSGLLVGQGISHCSIVGGHKARPRVGEQVDVGAGRTRIRGAGSSRPCRRPTISP
jgi:hypothetical protein